MVLPVALVARWCCQWCCRLVAVVLPVVTPASSCMLVVLPVVLPVVLVSTFGWCFPEVQVGYIRGLAAQALSWLGHIFE